MEDRHILDLYWQRSETAISETAKQYGSYCHSIAYRILRSEQDSEECVNEVYLRAWNTIPPQRPERLSTFLGRLTRNLSIDRCRRAAAEKRGGGEVTLALDELKDCVPARDGGMTDGIALTDALNRFLAALPAQQRKIFLRRYWYVSSVREIAEEYGISESRVKMSLFRSRQKLKTALEKEGFAL